MINTDISVVILTYNPKWPALLGTLHSVIIQGGVRIQLVISDDGSEDNLFSRAEQYLKSNNFSDYVLVPAEKNGGTVRNVHKGLAACTGKYVKLISPGDFLAGSDVLKKWVEILEKSGRKWSIGEAVYYSMKDNGYSVAKMPSQPLAVNLYKGENTDAVRWSYIVYEDITMGAAVLSELEITKEYISRLLDKVIYAEDNCYRLMVFDGYTAVYFHSPVVLYEYGDGVSTSLSDVWKKRLSADWNAATKEMLDGAVYDDRLKNEMREAITSPAPGLLGKLFQPARLKFSIGKHLIRNKTCTNVTPEMENIILYHE